MPEFLPRHRRWRSGLRAISDHSLLGLAALPRQDLRSVFGGQSCNQLALFGLRFGADSRRRRGAAIDREADGREKLLLARRRAETEHAGRFPRRILERMGSVGWNVDGRAGADSLRLATEGEFELTV